MSAVIKQITWKELEAWRAAGMDFQLIDVREPDEHHAYNIGGELIPLSQIVRQPHRLEVGKPIVVYCKRGVRSQIAIQRLRGQVREAEFYNLQGGIWSLMPNRR